MPLKELSWLYSNQERRYLGSSTTHARKPPLHQPGKRFKQVKQQSCCTIVVWLRLRVKTLGQKDTHTITQHTKCLFWSRFFCAQIPVRALSPLPLDLLLLPGWTGWMGVCERRPSPSIKLLTRCSEADHYRGGCTGGAPWSPGSHPKITQSQHSLLLLHTYPSILCL